MSTMNKDFTVQRPCTLTVVPEPRKGPVYCVSRPREPRINRVLLQPSTKIEHKYPCSATSCPGKDIIGAVHCLSRHGNPKKKRKGEKKEGKGKRKKRRPCTALVVQRNRKQTTVDCVGRSGQPKKTSASRVSRPGERPPLRRQKACWGPRTCSCRGALYRCCAAQVFVCFEAGPLLLLPPRPRPNRSDHPRCHRDGGDPMSLALRTVCSEGSPVPLGSVPPPPRIYS